MQTAIGALIPYKSNAEVFHDDFFKLMLLHTHYSGEDLIGYGKKGNEKLERYIIKSEHIDPNILVLNTELSPDVPVDRVQKINSAISMAERLNYSPIKILEYLGEPDPYGALQEWISWQFVNAKVQGRVQKIAITESGELQQMAAQMAQQMAAEAAKQTGGGGGAGGGGGNGQMEMFGGENAGLESNNPAMGGDPEIMNSGPGENTFEGVTGETRGMGGGEGEMQI